MPAADRVLDLSTTPAFVSVRNEQLVVRPKEGPETSLPLAEVAMVVLGGRHATLTQPVLAGLARVNAGVVIGGENHQPIAMVLPTQANTLATQRLWQQIGLTEPRRKRLWQSVVVAKIKAQARLLAELDLEHQAVRALAGRVKSGDPDNVEATAAQRYWPLLMGPAFRRRFDRPGANGLLNYGYAVLRAAMSRAICAAGLHPALGIHHRGRGNAFCLADDLMEPYRPIVDGVVHEIVDAAGPDTSVGPEHKKALIEGVTQRIEHEGEWRSSAEWFAKTAGSMLAESNTSRPTVFYPRGVQ
ncbi:MAG: type II CRISPR-associated endonuclease Cas1 [Planctomycetota bacterium]